MNIKISLLKYIDSYGIKKKHVIPETCSELSALPGQAAGTPVFRRGVSLNRRPFPATLGGKPPSRKTTIDEQKCDDYGWFNVIQYDPTHSFHMFPQQLWCVMIYWFRASHGLSQQRFLPPKSQYGDDRISAGFGVPHRLHLENAQRENSEGWSSRNRKKNGND